jgi:hypothetical protein
VTSKMHKNMPTADNSIYIISGIKLFPTGDGL